MRVPLPSPDVLKQQRLRQEAMERLAERDALAASRLGDPTDPGWLLVEEAAWRAESLSAEAGVYSDALALHTVAAMGVSPRPAAPAIGLVLAGPEDHGVLRAAPDDDPTVFLSPHSEDRAGLHLVLLEQEAPLLAAWLVPPPGPDGSVSALPGLGSLFAPAPGASAGAALPDWIALARPAPSGAAARLVVQVAAGAEPGLGLKSGAASLTVREARRIPLPGAADDLVLLSAAVPEGSTALELVYGDTRPRSIGLNPVLVINAPRTPDGRSVEVPRVGPARLDPKVGRALSPGALTPHRGQGVDDLLDALELVRVVVPAGQGAPWVELPDRTGAVLLQRNMSLADPATVATVSWLRQTDGAAGDLPVDAVRLVEQKPGIRPVIQFVGNPFPIVGGKDRERPRDTVRRAYGRGITPVSAFEVGMTEALLAEGLSWRLRLWSAADARLSEVLTWDELPRAVTGTSSAASATGSRARSPIAAELLQGNGLVAATGPYRGRASPDEQRRAAGVLQAWFERARGPHPSLDGLTVIGLRRVALETAWPALAPEFPTYALGARAQGDTLVDPDGERRQADRDAVLIDCVLVGLASAGAP